MSLRETNKTIINKYSQSTLSKFDIIGSYFVNLYYNEFYIKAKNLKFQGTYSNITDAYKNLLSSYVEFSRQQDFFKQIVKGIHTYCISTTKYTTMTHKECVDFMVSEFVPNNLWNSIREQQKNKLFHESLINCIKEFTEKIITNHLYIIIDHHDKDENIIILQDLFLTIILLEKDKIFSKFINPDKTSLDIFKNKIQQIINDKKKIINENLILKKKITILEDLHNKNANIILELQKNNKLLNNEILKLKENENILNKKLLQYINAIQVNYNKVKIPESTKVTKSELTKIPESTKVTKSELTKTPDSTNNVILIKQNKLPNKKIIKSVNNESINNKTVNNESVDNESVDNESVDNNSFNNNSVNNESVDNESIDNESIDNESIDNESVGNESVDEEFESYFNESNIPIISNLEFDKSEDYGY